MKSPVIAFTAILSNDTTLGPRAVLKYDQVLTNLGDAYEPTTGTFTALYDGLYSLSYTLISHPNNFVHLKMVQKRTENMHAVFCTQNLPPVCTDPQRYPKQRCPHLGAES